MVSTLGTHHMRHATQQCVVEVVSAWLITSDSKRAAALGPLLTRTIVTDDADAVHGSCRNLAVGGVTHPVGVTRRAATGVRGVVLASVHVGAQLDTSGLRFFG